jgi:hypothetical protein
MESEELFDVESDSVLRKINFACNYEIWLRTIDLNLIRIVLVAWEARVNLTKVKERKLGRRDIAIAAATTSSTDQTMYERFIITWRTFDWFL